MDFPGLGRPRRCFSGAAASCWRCCGRQHRVGCLGIDHFRIYLYVDILTTESRNLTDLLSAQWNGYASCSPCASQYLLTSISTALFSERPQSTWELELLSTAASSPSPASRSSRRLSSPTVSGPTSRTPRRSPAPRSAPYASLLPRSS